MKTVYLVRHGESELNVGTATHYQAADSPLTEKGRRQCEFIAERVSRLSIEALISSPWARAKDTAEAIRHATGHTPEYRDEFVEVHGPSSIVGLPFSDVRVGETFRRWSEALYRGSEPVEDGETFDMVRARAVRALAHLSSRTESRIAVVTHGSFARALILAAVFGEDFSQDVFRAFIGGSMTDNTGISMLVHSARPRNAADSDERWRLRVFNDHAHLG